MQSLIWHACSPTLIAELYSYREEVSLPISSSYQISTCMWYTRIYMYMIIYVMYMYFLHIIL